MDIYALIEPYKTSLVALVMTIPRFAGLFFMTPFLKTPVFNRLSQNGLYIAFTILLVPFIKVGMPPLDTGVPYFLGIMVKEFILGLLASFVFGIVFLAFQAAGFFVDNQRGAAMASSVDPLFKQTTSPTGQFFSQFIVVFFFSSGAFLILLGQYYLSYKLWPIWSFFPDFAMFKADFFIAQMDRLMRLLLIISGPMIIVMFLSEIGLAMISRFAPQLQVFFLSMPIKSAVGVFMLILYLPFFLKIMEQEIQTTFLVFNVLDPILR